ncbi:GPR125 [Bugula neritina]|uniref:GPR125 n=1 Tax=Bugula neritina TaxID=10212 RepID=A0A7J7KGZ8_BUGNE|nr:GPR125 [Bugula neritina]
MNCGNTGGIKVFELDPATTQLVFTNDTLPIDCTVSTEYVKHVNWYRNGRLVSTNISAKIEVVVKQTPPSLLTKTLILRNLTKERTGLWSCIANDGQTNFTKSLSIFTEPASCPEVTTETDKGKYKWPRTGHDSRAELMCKSGAKAYYTCNADAQWVDLDTQGCKYSSDITQLLWELSLSDFNITTSVEMVKTLMKMLMQSSDIISHKIDVIYVARVLSRISSSYYLYSKAEINSIDTTIRANAEDVFTITMTFNSMIFGILVH